MPIHTHPFIGPLSRTTQVSRYQKVKPIWILLKQQTVSGSGISWAICKSAPRSRHTTTPAPHHSVFLQAGCPSCRPTNSVKALKAGIPIHTCKSSTCLLMLQCLTARLTASFPGNLDKVAPITQMHGISF